MNKYCFTQSPRIGNCTIKVIYNNFLLAFFNLPVQPPLGMHIADFMPYMKTDKKVQAGKMRFIVPTALGQSAIVDDVTEQELMALFSI